mgnify:FL=1
MSNKWAYTKVLYTSQDEVDAAVVAQKVRLDNFPTDWVIVKEVTGSAVGGWIVPAATLSDSDIDSLDATKRYSVASIHEGENYLGLTASEATAKVAEIRTLYARWMNVNSVEVVTEHSLVMLSDDSGVTGEGVAYEVLSEAPPSNVDMSGYV